MIPSNRRSILASSAQRSFCLAGEREPNWTGGRANWPERASAGEGGKEGGREGGARRAGEREGGRGAEGGSCARNAPGWRRARPPAPPGSRRERAAADRSIPNLQPAGPACDGTSFAFGSKQVVRATLVEVTQGGRFFQSDELRPPQASTHPGAPGASRLEEERAFPRGVEVGVTGRRPRLCEGRGDTGGCTGRESARSAGSRVPSFQNSAFR